MPLNPNRLRRIRSFLNQHNKISLLMAVLGMLLSSWMGCVHAAPTTDGVSAQSDRRFDRSHYLIPGFSNHLIDIDILVYHDLLSARRAAKRHDTLRLRIALADANGHLLQMATPPTLAGLRDRIVSVAEEIQAQSPAFNARTWIGLIASIQHLSIPKADRSAREQLLQTAHLGQEHAKKGHWRQASSQIAQLTAEIEITAHVFPTADLRQHVRTAIEAASHGTPLWKDAARAVDAAINDTQWLIRPNGQNMIRAYDSAVAAYAEWPQAWDSRKSLRQAAWYLQRTNDMHKLGSEFEKAAVSNLNLPTIAHLQHVLALDIHHSRDKMSHPAPRLPG